VPFCNESDEEGPHEPIQLRRPDETQIYNIFTCRPCVSNDRVWIALPSVGPGVDVYEITSGREVARLPQGSGPILCCAFSPDGRYLATGGYDGKTRVYNTRDWSLVFEKVTHDGWVTALWFTPDGKLLLAGGKYYVVEAYRTADFTQMFSLTLASAYSNTNRAIQGIYWDNDRDQLFLLLDKGPENISSEPWNYTTLSVPPLTTAH
jgi:WD40 repeat protein